MTDIHSIIKQTKTELEQMKNHEAAVKSRIDELKAIREEKRRREESIKRLEEEEAKLLSELGLS